MQRPLTISDPSAQQSSVLQSMKIALATQTAHPTADGRAAHEAWMTRLPRASSVPELAQHLHGEMSASTCTVYTKAVLAEVMSMTSRWEVREEELVPPDDSCEAAGSRPAVDDVSAYRAWCGAHACAI